MSNVQTKSPSLLEKLQLQKMLDDKNTKGKVGPTLVNVLYDLLLSVGAGGFLGAVLGKHSFWPGLIATGAGYYLDLRPLKAIGVGMMASSHLLAPNQRAARTKAGFDWPAEKEDAKSRMTQYGSSILERTYLDKLINLVKGKGASTTSEETSTEQIASEIIQEPPADLEPTVNGLGEPDFSALDKFGQQIVASAVEYQRTNPAENTIRFQPVQMNGLYDDQVEISRW